ncbi:MAG: hypothetical protein DRP93_03430 [Candidatus Neomarinimicrobiota bacterium]|nr:MAG: hypothetical protein DRP93_03430 [Candidatus Neomarinimicrobiota bacterium]
MNNTQAKVFTDKIFHSIQKSKSIDDLIEIESSFDSKFRIDSENYSKINFNISPEDIDLLIKADILNDDYGGGIYYCS